MKKWINDVVLRVGVKLLPSDAKYLKFVKYISILKRMISWKKLPENDLWLVHRLINELN